MTEDGIAQRARSLAEALADGGFARLRVRDGDTEIEIRRGVRGAGSPPGAPAGTSASASQEASAPPQRPVDVLKSDVVGIVRFSRPPVAEGAELDGDRELGYVEVLGIRNAVRSRGPGRVAEVFVTDGQPVEYGQPLFTIER